MQCYPPNFPTPASCHDALSMAEDGYRNKSLIHKMGPERKLSRRTTLCEVKPEMVNKVFPLSWIIVMTDEVVFSQFVAAPKQPGQYLIKQCPTSGVLQNIPTNSCAGHGSHNPRPQAPEESTIAILPFYNSSCIEHSLHISELGIFGGTSRL